MSEQQLLIKIVITPQLGRPSGIKVYEDGRYEYLSDKDFAISESGRVTPIYQEHAWRYVWQFSPKEMTELRELVRASGFDQLAESQGAAAVDGRRYAWEVHIDGQTYTGESKSGQSLPEIERFFQKFNQIRELPSQSSVWRVWVNDHYEERVVNGIVNGVPSLRPLVQALLTPTTNASNGPSVSVEQAKLANDQVVAEVVWQVEEQVTEVHRLLADGQYLVQKNDGTQTKRPFSPEQVEAVLGAAASIAWPSLSNPINVNSDA